MSDPSISLQGGSRPHPLPPSAAEPLLTILIVVFHDPQELQAILGSIAPWKTTELEVVVIDGFSQDGTVELLRASEDTVDYWRSEPDTGIYNAMNKGLQAARGVYVLHLNAGDRLLTVPWAELQQCAAEAIDVVCCRVLLDGTTSFLSRTSLLSKIDNTWHHQGTFYRRHSHLGYNETYRTHADFDHNQRLLKKGCSYRQLPVAVATHDLQGITSTLGNNHLEVYRSVRANYGWLYLQLAKLRFLLLALRDKLQRKRPQRSRTSP